MNLDNFVFTVESADKRLDAKAERTDPLIVRVKRKAAKKQ